MIERPPGQSTAADWPELPLAAWADTCATLHLWTQVVGKIRLAHAPMVNHWWQVALYVTSRGLTTSPIPYGARSFQIDFDFIDHRLEIRTSNGEIEAFALGPRSVADFYLEVMARLRGLGLETRIWTMPVEIEGAIPFDRDREHSAYDPQYVHRFWRILVQVDRLFTLFRSSFIGKVSPVHFFWGSFDLAVTRFSGRTAPRLESDSPNLGRWVMQEAYSHEVSSCRLLARQWRLRPAGLLQLCLSRAGAFRRGSDDSLDVLRFRSRPVHPALRHGASGFLARRCDPGLPAPYL